MAIMIDIGREERDPVGAGAHWGNVADEWGRIKARKIWRCFCIAVTHGAYMSKSPALTARGMPMHLLPDRQPRRASRIGLNGMIGAILGMQPGRAKKE